MINSEVNTVKGLQILDKTYYLVTLEESLLVNIHIKKIYMKYQSHPCRSGRWHQRSATLRYSACEATKDAYLR